MIALSNDISTEGSSMNAMDAVLKVAREYNRPETEAAAGALVDAAGRATLEKVPLRDALTQLRDNRWFDLLRDTTERIIHTGDKRAFVRRLYGQALIDTRAIDVAIPFLEQLVRESQGDAGEYDDARGLLGRAWKQAYVNRNYRDAEEARKLLQTSAEWYWIPYRDNKENLYHGINTVAVLARAERDGIRLSDGFPDWRELARTLADEVTRLFDRQREMTWDLATGAEACVALAAADPEQWNQALVWLNSYVNREANAFQIGGTLRQLTEVWGLSRTSDGGAPLVLLLEAEILRKKGGQSLDVRGARDVMTVLDRDDEMLEALLSDERYVSMKSLRKGMARACAVGRIAKPNAALGGGTGFVVRAKDLDETLDGQLFITNNHVIPRAIPNLNHAVITFEAADGDGTEYPVASQLWTSKELDVTVLRLKKDVKDVEPFSFCDALPSVDVDEKPRVFVIGHPGGGDLSFSVSDNRMIDHLDPKVHYRTPTEPGSSGSPVFDESWTLLALHRKGGKEIPRLHGDGSYAANEGHFVQAVLKEFRARPR